MAPADLAAGVPSCRGFRGWAKARPRSSARDGTGFAGRVLGNTPGAVGLALRCTNCNATSISSLFYLGPDAHVCRMCGSPFELADPNHDRRAGADRRTEDDDPFGVAEWRSGSDRRIVTAG